MKKHNRMAFLALILVGLAFVSHPQNVEAQERLRVALVSGAHAESYQANRAMSLLKDHLEQNYAIDCVLVTSQEGSNSFEGEGLEVLSTVDAAVFHVRRKTLSERDLMILREFIDSGKGFVALRSTSHAWENCPDFDQEVLGAKYRGTFHADDRRSPSMDIINIYQHPIFTGAREFTTQQYMYQYEDIADDVQIIMEGTVGEVTTPMAWTREYKGGRIFRLVPFHIEMFQDPDYLKMLGNGILWVTRRQIPGAKASVQRTYMPEAHPGAFAITFPQGPGICYDPVRGGINYIWDGDYIDLRPRWTTKQGQPAKYIGDIFYSENSLQPMRTGSPDREPEYQFRGYRIVDGLPEFSYTINGRLVREEMRPLENGEGVERHFQVEGDEPFWLMLEPQNKSEVTISGAVREDNYIRYDGAGGGFVVEISHKK
ncbi:MAG: ThuA domain-containing protein [Balneolales bacterium]